VESGLTCEWIHRLVLALAQIFNTFACVCRISKDESTWEEVLDCEWSDVLPLAAAAVDDLTMRQYPLMDGKDVVGEMVFHGIAEQVAVGC
jgi:hypothetical protein